VSIHEAENRLSNLVERALSGEEIIIEPLTAAELDEFLAP
jgi:hypothetical protein